MDLKMSNHSITDSSKVNTKPQVKNSSNMKCIFLTVIACVVAIEAKPYMGLGGIGLGYGLGGASSGFANGGSFGDNMYNSGANGFGNQGYHNGGLNNFHNVGQHHSSLSSITQADNTDNHDIGGSQLFDTGALSNGGFNQFGNGGSQFGNGYGSGHQMSSFLL